MAKNKEVKASLISHTRELMRTNGNITIREIAEASFVNIAAVNYYFEDKGQLIGLVVHEVISELKNKINDKIKSIQPDENLESRLTDIIGFLYEFALENTGIVNYILLHLDTEKNAPNILIQEFLSDNEFTHVILRMISAENGIVDEKVLYARYTLLLSSFCIPLFIEIMQKSTMGNTNVMMTLLDDQYRKAYVHELIRVIQ